jgi:hypothetical protein
MAVMTHRQAGGWAPGMRALCAAVASQLAFEVGVPDPPWVWSHLLLFDNDFLRVTIRHRVQAIVQPALVRFGASPDVQSAMRAARWQQQQAAIRSAYDHWSVVSALESAGVRTISIKGLSLAVQTTGDLTTRGAGDVDVLIDRADAIHAFAALETAGMRQVPGFCPGAGTALFAAASRVQSQAIFDVGDRHVDLHWRLDPVESGIAWQFDDLWRRRVPVDVGGRRVETLSPLDACVFSAAHGARDTWSSLRQVVDHVRLMRMIDPDAGRERAVDAGALLRWETAEVVAAHLAGGSVRTSRRARHRGELMWSWLIRDEGPGVRGGVGAVNRRFRANVGLYDSRLASLRRVETHIWPIPAMAQRRLGATGDAHPWLYLAGAPLLVPVRVWAAVKRDL